MDHRSGAAEILSGGLARVFSKPGQPEEREMYSFPVPEVKSLKVSTFERRNYEVSESIVWWVLDKTSVYLPSGGIHILEWSSPTPSQALSLKLKWSNLTSSSCMTGVNILLVLGVLLICAMIENGSFLDHKASFAIQRVMAELILSYCSDTL